MTRREWLNRDLLAAFAMAAIMLSGVAMGATLSNSTPVSGTIPVGTQDGLTVNVADNGGEMDITWPATDTVEVATGAGNATFSSPGTAEVTVDQMTGTWTNVSGVSASSNNVSINPEDKQAYGIGGDVDSVSVNTDLVVDDGQIDVVYAGSSGTTTLILRGLPANEKLRLVDDDTGANLGAGETDSNGVLRVTGLDNSEHDVTIESQSGGPGLSNPTPEGQQSTDPNTATVDVTDPDFDSGEEVDVEFEVDGTVQGTDTLTSAGTASVSLGSLSQGDHTLNITATDSSGNVNTISTTFSTPSDLTIRRATPQHEIIDDRKVTATFIEDGSTIENRSTTTGVIDLSGLTVDKDITILLRAESTSGTNVKDRSYYTREFIIQDITEQNTAYMLDTNTTSVETRFTLQDRTSLFEGNGAQLYVQRIVNRTGTAEYKTVAADRFGVEGYTTDLDKGTKYRLIVRNQDDDMRVLGTYDADVSETVQLTVGSVSADPDSPGLGYELNTTRFERNGDAFARVAYNDNASLTDDVTIEIFERGNRANKLVDNQTFSGPLGSFQLTESIPASEENTTYVALITINRDGETKTIRKPLGPNQPILTGMAPWLKAVISIGSIFVVAGLFSRLNGAIGGLVVAGLGGIFYFVGFLPRETGIGVVVLSMVTAGIIFINGRRGT